MTEDIRWEKVIETTMYFKSQMGIIYPDGTEADALAAANAVGSEYAKIAAIQNVLDSREQLNASAH